MTSEAQKRVTAKYKIEKMKQLAIRFSPNEMDLFDHIKSQPNIAGYIKRLVREGQKGSRELMNPLPKSANVERKPRYGVRPSLLGSLGPEFASVTCVVDNTGHCVIGSLSMGEPTERQIVGFINDHMEDIALANDRRGRPGGSSAFVFVSLVGDDLRLRPF